MGNAGYSGRPLGEKLGITDGMRLVVLNAPDEYLSWLGVLPQDARIDSKLVKPVDAVHVFLTRRADLERVLAELRALLEPAGFVWVSWPKRASKVTTDLTENVIRQAALPLGFVDVKVCAVSDTWSGLKLVIRKSERRAQPAILQNPE